MRNWKLWLPFLIALVGTLYHLQPIDGQVGHDYYHHYTRTLIGALHFWQNGLSIPHYTASLCGGIPLFADPQSEYFSLPQWLAFIWDPWWAIQVNYVLCYCLGYFGFIALARTLFGPNSYAGHLGALVYLLNGFSFAHHFVGHMTHPQFLLIPLMINAWIHQRTVGFTLGMLYLIYSGALHILIVLLLTLLLMAPIVFQRKGYKGPLKCLLFSSLIVVACASGKAIASWLYSAHFVSNPIDHTEQSFVQFVFRYFWFIPSLTPSYLPFGRLNMGIWEFVGYVSKFTIPSTLVLFYLGITKRRYRNMCAAILILGVLTLVLAYGQPLNSKLPFLSHYHNPTKMLAAFIPLLCLGLAFVLHQLGEKRGYTLFPILAALLLFEGFYYQRIYVEKRIGLKLHKPDGLHAKLKKIGRLPPVKTVTQTSGTDIVGLWRGETSLRCYEPLFGYRLEALKAKLTPGPTRGQGEFFNLTHPGCLLYPKHFDCQPWDKISVRNREAFEKFRMGQLSWGVPPWHRWLLRINFIFIGLLIILWVKKYLPSLRSVSP